jgi:hypothetical protein
MTLHPSEIASYDELLQVRRSLKIAVRETKEDIADSADEFFSLDNLVSLIAPPGSTIDRLIGGVETGIATVRGIIRGIDLFRSSR